MTRLCELASKYGTDKGPEGHCYTVIYDALFKNRNIRKVLEVGLSIEGTNAAPSLRMWADYYPQAEIWGLDKEEKTLVNEGRIHSILCDQSNKASLEVAARITGGDFDLLVDDGSHISEDQILTAQAFIPLMAPGSLYIIEDMRTENIPPLLKDLMDAFPFFAFRRIPSLAFISGRYCHSQLIVIEIP